MTDETKVVTEEVVVETPVTETVATTQEQEAPQFSEVERQAMEQGWKPKDQWEGDPTKWRPADVFLDRGELLGKLKAQGSELKEVKEMLRHMSEHQKRTYQAGYEQALAELKRAKVEALRNEDHEAIVEIDERISDAKEAIKTIKQQPQQRSDSGEASPTFQQWLSRNKWYKEDDSMRVWANTMAIEYAKKVGRADEEEIYDYLDKEARKTFPHKFNRVAPPDPDGNGRRSAGGTKSTQSKGGDEFEALVASLSTQEQRTVRNLVDRGYVTKEQYIKDYNLVKDRGR